MEITIKVGNSKRVIEANNYLKDRIDETTGEVIGKSLDRNIRLAWFRSENPHAVITKTLRSSGTPLDVIGKLLNVGTITSDVCQLIREGCGIAIAEVEIFDNELDYTIANEYAARLASETFSYNCEAALNAATERALIAAGYFVPEELGFGEIVPMSDVNTVNTNIAPSNPVTNDVNTVAPATEPEEINNIQVNEDVVNSLSEIEKELSGDDDSLFNKIWSAESDNDIVTNSNETGNGEAVSDLLANSLEDTAKETEEVVCNTTQAPVTVTSSENANTNTQVKNKNFKTMTFAELMQVMSYEEACKVTIPSGKFKGYSILELYNHDKRKLAFYVEKSVSEYLKAAATIVMDGLNK